MSNELQLQTSPLARWIPVPRTHDILGHALHERQVELGGNHRVPCFRMGRELTVFIATDSPMKWRTT